MRIGEFAAAVGLTEYSVRYYEKAGVLRPAKRDRNGYREFDEGDLAWMDFVGRLKAMAVPIEDIRRYAELREAGDSTMAERLALLETHEKRIAAEAAEKGEQLERLREKIAYYRSALCAADRRALP